MNNLNPLLEIANTLGATGMLAGTLMSPTGSNNTKLQQLRLLFTQAKYADSLDDFKRALYNVQDPKIQDKYLNYTSKLKEYKEWKEMLMRLLKKDIYKQEFLKVGKILTTAGIGAYAGYKLGSGIDQARQDTTAYIDNFRKSPIGAMIFGK